MKDRRAAVLLLLAALVGVVAVGLPTLSTAAFTSRSTATATVRAAADWTPPTVAVTSPGSPLKDTVTVGATASDGETGVTQVVLQYLAPGASSWTTLCTDTTAPYSCSWATRTVPDGTYDLRARATDGAGHVTTSATVRTVVANTVMVVISEPGEVVRGTVPMSATLHNGGTTSYTLRIEYSPAGANRWTSICSGTSATLSCAWNTSALNGDHDLRAVATAGSTTITSAVVADVTVDNTAPQVTMTDPGTPLSGTRTFAATATDVHSGVATVVLQQARTGTSTWTTLCTIAVEPWTCRVNTTTLLDGSYSFRAVATDVAGNPSTSPTVTNRLVDNTVSAVSLEDAGSFLGGTVTLVANATSTAGVTSVRIQRAATGTTSWADICTRTTAPYQCDWDTTSVPDGAYDLRAVLVDGTGATTTSAVIAARRVDNTPLRGVDVQTVNGGATAGRLEPGDSITFTYSDEINLATIARNWSGAATPVTLRVRDGNLLGLGNRGDTLDVLVGNAAVNLGTVNLREDYVKSNRTLSFAGTMTAGTVVLDGRPRTTVTVTLGALGGGGNGSLRTVSTASAMVWTPSTAATGLTGTPVSGAPVTESGPADREF